MRDLDLDPKRYTPRASPRGEQPQERPHRRGDLLASPGRRGPITTSGPSSAYTQYQRRLRQANALDFDDIIMMTVNLLQAFPDVAEYYRRRFRHILVDEYQDTNLAQYQLIKELVGGGAPGRGALRGAARRAVCRRRLRPVDLCLPRRDDPQHPRVREGLPQGADDPARAELPVDPAHPPRRQLGDRPQRGAPGQEPLDRLRGRRHDRRLRRGQRARRGGVRRQADRRPGTEGVRPGDVAVFYRTNAQSRAIEEVLVRVGLPYKVVGGTRFYERERSRTRWPTCASSPTRPTRSTCGGSSTSPSAASATGPRRASPRSRNGSAFRSSPRSAGPRTPRGSRRGRSRPSRASLSCSRSCAPSMRRWGRRAARGHVEQSGYLAELKASHDPQDETRLENLAELVAVAQEYDEERIGPAGHRWRSSSSRSRSSPTRTRSRTSRTSRRKASSP